ncbi:MAG: hypothetical protein NUW12_03720 [Firmicutes bacterium]|nr:hypothetical protein [Bacillota bacterium]MDH7494932.1 hypothetical protein [Bacillota bacterium]
MRASLLFTNMSVPIVVALYTLSFGLWLWRRKNVRGAVGVFLLAACCLAVPLFLLMVRG